MEWKQLLNFPLVSAAAGVLSMNRMMWLTLVRRRRKALPFLVPCLPLVPGVAIVINIYLMLKLSVVTSLLSANLQAMIRLGGPTLRDARKEHPAAGPAIA